MADDSFFPGWADGDSLDNAWNSCVLGSLSLIGLCQVHSMACGVDVDHKKIKGADKPTSKDTGIKVSKFEIDQWITSSQYNDAMQAVQLLGPHRPGQTRGPVGITHPLPNGFGIQEIRITDIEVPRSPTAKAGMHIIWKIEQWFDKPVESKAKDKLVQQANNLVRKDIANAANQTDAANHEQFLHASDQIEQRNEDIDPTTFQPLKPSENALSNMFGKLGGIGMRRF